jgi:hypothetical protein
MLLNINVNSRGEGGRKEIDVFLKIFSRKYYNILNFVANISVTLIYTNCGSLSGKTLKPTFFMS